MRCGDLQPACGRTRATAAAPERRPRGAAAAQRRGRRRCGEEGRTAKRTRRRNREEGREEVIQTKALLGGRRSAALLFQVLKRIGESTMLVTVARYRRLGIRDRNTSDRHNAGSGSSTCLRAAWRGVRDYRKFSARSRASPSAAGTHPVEATTYMNRSGLSVRQLSDFYKIVPTTFSCL